MGGIRTEVGTITEGSEIQGSVNGISVGITTDTGASRTVVGNQVIEAIPKDTQLVGNGNMVLGGEGVPLQIGKAGVKLVDETFVREKFDKNDFGKQIDYSRCYLQTHCINGQGIKGELVTGRGQSKALKDVQHEKIGVLRSTRLSRQQADIYSVYQEPLLDPTRDQSLLSRNGGLYQHNQPDREPCPPDGKLHQPDREPCPPDRKLHQPDWEPCHPDGELHQSDREPCHPDGELHQPDWEPCHPDGKLHQSDREPCHPDGELHQSDQEPCHPDGELHQPEQEPSHPDEEPSEPDNEQSQPDEMSQQDHRPCQPDSELSYIDDETQQPHDELHHPIMGSHHPDKELLQPDEETAVTSHHPDEVWHNTKDESPHPNWEPYDPGGKPYHLDKEPLQPQGVLHYTDEGFGQQKRNQ